MIQSRDRAGIGRQVHKAIRPQVEGPASAAEADPWE
jgi:hypothetical protein